MIDNLKNFPRPYNGRMICVDPGIGLGIAVFGKEQKVPDSTFVLDWNPAARNWKEKCDDVIDKASQYFKLFSGIYAGCPVFIEEPQFFDSFRGVTSARDGALGKLIFFFGRFWQITKDLGFNPVAVPIPQWKGQLNKSQVQERVRRAIDQTYTSHECDAVGIGLFLRGIL